MFFLGKPRHIAHISINNHQYLPVVPARGGAEVALGIYIYIRPFSSIERACAVLQPSPCVHLFSTSHFTLLTARFTLHTSHSTLHTTQSTLHTALFAFHTSHFTLHSPHFTLQEHDQELLLLCPRT